METVRLRCEHRGDVPASTTPPRGLGWALAGERRDERQTAYRILVAETRTTSPRSAGRCGTSGRVASADTVDMPYARPAAAAGRRARLDRARLGPRRRAADWSAPARFRTGPEAGARVDPPRRRRRPRASRHRGHETAARRRSCGLTPCPYLRATFAVDGAGPARVLYATARGVVELAAQRRARRRRRAGAGLDGLPHAHRVRRPRRDRAAARRARTRWARSSATAGTRATSASTTSAAAPTTDARPAAVRARTSSTRTAARSVVALRRRAGAPRPARSIYSDLIMGERYDARARARAGTEPGYDDAGWSPVRAAPRGDVALVPERAQPIRVTEEIAAGRGRPSARPACTSSTSARTWSAGSGCASRARAGTDGRAALRRDARPRRRAATSRTCAARGRSTTYMLARRRASRCTSRASRSTASATSRSPASTGAAASTRSPGASCTPTCRAPARSRARRARQPARRNIDWGQRGNFLAVPTDCPQRDERLGWTGDAQVFAADRDASTWTSPRSSPSGATTWSTRSRPTAPTPTSPRACVFERDGAPAWADAGVIVPWALYRATATGGCSSATGPRWSATWTTCSATTRTCCGRAGATTTTATGCRSAPTRRRT